MVEYIRRMYKHTSTHQRNKKCSWTNVYKMLRVCPHSGGSPFRSGTPHYELQNVRASYEFNFSFFLILLR